MSDRLEELVTRLIALSVPEPDGARRLPAERDLCDALDISRGALREQLAMLENLGVLRRRQGHGTYLDAPDASFIRTYFTLMSRLDFLTGSQFASAREMLEEAVVAEAARRVSDADVAALHELVTELIARSVADDHEGALEADLAIHNRLYEIVDNPIFNMLNQGLSHVLRDSVEARRRFTARNGPTNADGSKATDTVHSEIVDALATRDPDLARAAMRKHFVEFSAVVPDNLPPGKPTKQPALQLESETRQRTGIT